MFKTKKFIAVSIIDIMGLAQTVSAAVPKFNGSSYNGMTSSQIAKDYERIGDKKGLKCYKLKTSIEFDYKSIADEAAAAIKDYKSEERKTIMFFEEAANNIAPQLFGNGTKVGGYNLGFSPKYKYNQKTGVYTISYFIENANMDIVGYINADVIVNEEGKEKIVPKEEVKGTPISEITDRTKYTFPDFPRSTNVYVENDDFYSDKKAASIYELFEKGKISGDSKGYFNPKASLTRAEFATMLVNVFELEAKGNGETFTDTEGHWAKSSIDIVSSRGLLKGVASGKFDPNGKVNYEQISVIAERIMIEEGKDVDFSDGVYTLVGKTMNLTYGKAAFEKCSRAQLFDDTNSWHPVLAATREDAVYILYRLAEYLK